MLLYPTQRFAIGHKMRQAGLLKEKRAGIQVIRFFPITVSQNTSLHENQSVA